jgi:hypothetical protein
MGALAAGTAAAAPFSAAGMIVADRRIAASGAFATEAARSGGRIAWIDGDITDLWYDDLDPLWRREKSIVSGLTEYGAFFCLERLAMDRGLRVAFRGEHRREGTASLLHTITGPAAVVADAALFNLSGAGWAKQVARMALAARGRDRPAVRVQKLDAAMPGQPPLLISWVLAPKARIEGEAA